MTSAYFKARHDAMQNLIDALDDAIAQHDAALSLPGLDDPQSRGDRAAYELDRDCPIKALKKLSNALHEDWIEDDRASQSGACRDAYRAHVLSRPIHDFENGATLHLRVGLSKDRALMGADG